MPADHLQLLTSLCEALDGARRVRAEDDLVGALDRAAAVIAETLGYRRVAVHVHRPAWHDFVLAAAHGPAPAELGTSRPWDDWAPLLAPGPGDHARTLRAAEQDGEQGTWRHGGELLAAMRRADGALIGVIAVEDPVDGRAPCDADVDRLVAVATVAALAVERAQEAKELAEQRRALERLLGVSARIADQRSGNGVLDEVCAAVRDALGFELVIVLLADERGRLRPAAAVGHVEDGELSLDDLAPVLQPTFERHGCYLIDAEEAEGLTGLIAPLHRSVRNGRGPHAWDRHWLVAPLHGPRGALRGLLWADEPGDRRIPGRERLQALRLFADQAGTALRATHDVAPPNPRVRDPLTGLADRATFLERLRHAVQRTRRTPEHVAVLFVDLDDFKAVNDRLGHAAGDALLQAVAARIDESVRPGDTVARFGGDEFVVLCEDVGGAAPAMAVAERLRASLAEPVVLAGGAAQVTCSIGVALPDGPERSPEAVLQAADRAMYEVKAAGRDGARLAAPGNGWN